MHALAQFAYSRGKPRAESLLTMRQTRAGATSTRQHRVIVGSPPFHAGERVELRLEVADPPEQLVARMDFQHSGHNIQSAKAGATTVRLHGFRGERANSRKPSDARSVSRSG